MAGMFRLFVSWAKALEYGSIVLVVAAVVFAALEQNFSFRKINKPWKETFLDLQYFFVGLLYPPTIRFGIAAILAWLMVRTRPHPVSTLVFGFELLVVLFIDDLWVYIRHRTFHSRVLWPFHSVHHQSEHLNWISGQRQHPIEVIIDLTGESLLFMALRLSGANLRVLFWAGIFIGLWNFLAHSNVRWTFGPLRYILVSPVQHRWHHSDTKDALDKNFAVMFSCIDIALGTFYMPGHLRPDSTGIHGDERKNYPGGFVSQFLYPFKK